MTTFQDPQPQSRRAVRRSERGEAFDPQAPEPLVYPESSASTETWDTVARRAAQLPSATARTDATVATGRRAAPATPAQPFDQPPVQQAQPPVQPTFRRRGTSVPPAETAASTEGSEQPGYRARDFSPEGSRPAAPQTWPDVTPAAPSAATAAPSDLDYHTEARLHYEVPLAPAMPPSTIPSEQTMSRRELRAQLAMEQQVEDAARQSTDASAPVGLATTPAPNVFPPAPEPSADTALTNAMAEFDALSQRAEAAQRADAQRLAEQAAAHAAEQQAALQAQQAAAQQAQQIAAQRAAAEQAAAQLALAAQQQALAAEQAAQQQAAAQQSWAAQQQSAAVQQPAPPVHQQAAPVVVQQAAPPVVQQHVAPEPEPQSEEPASWTPPLGHWAAQLDDHDVFETTINRTVGGASATTSALVVQTIPGSNDIRGPLTGTGEIMLTGSIDLPRSFSSTGASARFDPEGMDAFFDAGDAEVISTDSAPVRAIRAVSTHNSGQGVTHTQKPKGTRALTVLMVAASSMAVAVAGLLVASFALNIF